MADATDGSFAICSRCWARALILPPGRFEHLLGASKAHGRLWGATRPALLRLVRAGCDVLASCSRLLLSFSGRLVGGRSFMAIGPETAFDQLMLHMEQVPGVVRLQMVFNLSQKTGASSLVD